MLLRGSSVDIADATFTSCSVSATGGAIRIEGGATTVSGTSFTSCTASYRGGAIALMQQDSTTTLASTLFTDCAASEGGDDIYMNVPDGYPAPLTCIAGCNDAGMHMPSGSCWDKAEASVYAYKNAYTDLTVTCRPYCSSAASDCSIW